MNLKANQVEPRVRMYTFPNSHMNRGEVRREERARDANWRTKG